MAIEKKVFRSGPYADLFCQGVRVGDTIYLAGRLERTKTALRPKILSRR